MSKKESVCVTGAGGYLASWLVKLLLSKGYIVHGTVRDPSGEKNVHLKKLENASENLKLFTADLFDYQGLYAAVHGCTGVFHVASPLPPPNGSGPSKEEMVGPAVTGTRNVLKASSEAKVRKLVVVSSIAAVSVNPKWTEDQVVNEECWSDMEFCDTNQHWYLLSKTLAEKEVWEYAKTSEFKVVTVCPSIIIGPLLQPTMNSSSSYLLGLIKGGSESTPSAYCDFVDVRDTAEALLLVYENPEAEGRYICSLLEIKTEELVQTLKDAFPCYNYPKSFIKTGQWPKLSVKKLENLGWKYRTLEETIVDSVNNYIERGDLVASNNEDV